MRFRPARARAPAQLPPTRRRVPAPRRPIPTPRSRATSANSAPCSRATSANSAPRSRATCASSRPRSAPTCRPWPTFSAIALSASAPPVAAPTGSAAVTASDTLCAARRPRQPSDGLPSVSTAAMINPPIRLTSVRKARRSSALRCGSTSFQKVCPPRLPGTTLNASAAEANRGSLPVAKSRPPPIWTAPLIRATVSALEGTLVPTGSGNFFRPSIVGRAASAAGLGLRRASTPRPMKTADNMGRAIRRINMAGEFPRSPLHKRASGASV